MEASTRAGQELGVIGHESVGDPPDRPIMDFGQRELAGVISARSVWIELLKNSRSSPEVMATFVVCLRG